MINPKVEHNVKRFRISDFTKPDYLRVVNPIPMPDPTQTRSVVSKVNGWLSVNES